jgi:hypothetical protein
MTTDTLRRVTGVFRTPEGSVLPNRTLTWFRERREVQAQGSSVVLDEPFYVQTNNAGAIDHHVMAGNYVVFVRLKDADRYFRVSVPDQPGPFNIADLVDAPPVTPEIISTVQGFLIEARALAADAADSAALAQQGATGAVAFASVYSSVAAGLAATTVGGQFTVVLPDRVQRFRHDPGPVATLVAEYPTIDGVASAAARSLAVQDASPDVGIHLRLDLGVALKRQPNGDAVDALANVGTVSFPDRLAVFPDGTWRNGSRVHMLSSGYLGAWFQPEVAQAWNPGLGGFDYVGTSAADSTAASPVVGITPKTVSATTSGSAQRYVRLSGIDTIAGEKYQIDAIVKVEPAVAYLGVRFPPGFSDPTAGSAGNIVTIDMATRRPLVVPPDMQHEVTLLQDAGQDWVHIRARATCVTAQTNQWFGIVTLSSGSPSLSSNFAAGPLLQLALLSVQRVPSIALPCASPISAASIPGSSVMVDLSSLPMRGDAVTVLFDFAVPEGTPEADTVPLWRVDAGGSSCFGLDMVGRNLRATIRAPTRVHVNVADLYADRYRCAVSYDGATLRLAVNGTVASVATAQDLASIWSTLRLGHATPCALGTLRRFSGAVRALRVLQGASSEHDLRAMTARDVEPALGEHAPVVVAENGEAIISRDAAGRVDIFPGARLATALATGAAFELTGLPADAMAITPRADGLHFLSDAYGNRTHRLKRNNDGFVIGHRHDNRVDVIWANGQSLAYGNVYNDPVVWEDSPYFFDVDDGLANSVFGFSSSGRSTDRLAKPYITTPGPGAGGVIYPTIHHLARVRAEQDAAPIPIIAKTIGQQGENIADLWPFGIYDTGQDTGTLLPGKNGQHWANVRRWHQSVVDACNRLGLVPYCPAFLWVQGTADANNANYKANLTSARGNLDTLVAEFYGQTEGVPHFFLTQSGGRTDTSDNRWLVTDLQLDWASETPGAHLVCPLYQPDIVLQDANVHPNYTSTTIIGELAGWAMAEVLAGRSWHIGRPAVTVSGTTITLDYSQWLRPDEKLMIRQDVWYGGVGIQNVGITLHNILQTTGGVQQRYGPCNASVVSVTVSPDGKRYIVTLDQPIVPTLGYRIGYAAQFQNTSVTDPLHYARRGLLTTTLEKPSLRLPGRTLKRWIPSWTLEVLV